MTATLQAPPSCLARHPERLQGQGLAKVIDDWYVSRADDCPFSFGPCPGLEVWRQEEGCRCFERCLVLENDLARCRQIQQDIVTLSELYEFSEHDQYAIHISLEEALVNAVVHGNGADPARKIHIDYTVNVDEVRVRIADEGPGFDASAVPDPTLPENLQRPGGRGLMFMRYYMSAVEYNERGNCMQMIKRKGNRSCGS